jgi:decaprenyl-phosphate phosphoribosyltransferase
LAANTDARRTAYSVRAQTDLRALVGLLRAPQYVKNGFIFLPLFFAGEFDRADLLLKDLIAFVAFCLVASSVYIFNDIRDVREDSNHPTKRHRPIASGQVGIRTAWATLTVLLLAGLAVAALFFPPKVFLLLIVYLSFNALYSAGLKRVPIVDIAIIGVGFVIRLFVGSSATDVPLTGWIITMTFFLALLIGFAKRRDDIILSQNQSQTLRRNIDGYNLEFVNAGIAVMASVIVASYIMYTITPETIVKFRSDKLYLTTLFVILGILRYIQITFVAQKSGSPTRILMHDRFLQLIIACWILMFAVILYWR